MKENTKEYCVVYIADRYEPFHGSVEMEDKMGLPFLHVTTGDKEYMINMTYVTFIELLTEEEYKTFKAYHET